MQPPNSRSSTKQSMFIGTYQLLCDKAQIEPYQERITLAEFAQTEDFANKQFNERFAAALHVLLTLALNQTTSIKRVDKTLLDYFIARIDKIISLQLDEILHHSEFQQIESLWRGLKYVVDHVDCHANTKIELLDVDKQTLAEDFKEVAEASQSGLYKQVYEREYDTPGGEPFTAMISPFEFDASVGDVSLLTSISHVASVAHCPFIGSVGGAFFQKMRICEINEINDLVNYLT